MKTSEEPSWVIAKRTSDIAFRNAAVGVWLACFPVALIMMIVSPLESGARMWAAAAMFFFTVFACLLLRRKTAKRSFIRTFSTTCSGLSFIAGISAFSAGVMSVG